MRYRRVGKTRDSRAHLGAGDPGSKGRAVPGPAVDGNEVLANGGDEGDLGRLAASAADGGGPPRRACRRSGSGVLFRIPPSSLQATGVTP